ncbi:DNA-binding SCF ubiquitin ligase subunit DIA2 [Saccharomyces eubayanus]|uniref:DNA-binding SCF ubiquitin ligase subunit DIA2 n=1 Tax=Saccharomyces eubayanus TaxID=1080349 RepID=UPI0006C2ED2D|nr:DIA2-like protein [Saccharomyces eubayanus]KOG96587.1 DIA2-like protein [Saccharomyces eubayanus]
MSLPADLDTNIDSAVLKAIELGTRLFRSGEYLQAKRIFTNALKVCDSYSQEQIVRIRSAHHLDTSRPDNKRLRHPKYIKILDNICACYEKLDDLKSCLSTSQRSIQLDPENAKCYVRCVRTFIKLKDWKRAYKMCSRGLQLSGNANSLLRQQRQFIKQNIAKTQDIQKVNNGDRKYIDPLTDDVKVEKRKKNSHDIAGLSRPKKLLKNDSRKIDLFGDLPIELLPIIIRSFSSKELITLTLVCNKWRDKILYHLSCFREFNFNSISFRNFVKFMDFLRQNFTRTYKKYNLSQLKISSKIASEELRIAQMLFTKMPKCINFQRLILSMTTLTTTQFYKLMMGENREFFSKLMELSLMITYRPDRQHEWKILQNCSQLKKIELIFVNSMISIANRTNSIGSGGSFSSVNGSVNEIVLAEDQGEQEIAEEKIVYNELEKMTLICDKKKIKNFPLAYALLNDGFPRLQKLIITGVTFPINNRGMVTFEWLSNFPILRELWLEDNDNCELGKFLQVLKDSHVWKNMQKLTFRENKLYTVTDLDESLPIANDSEVQARLYYGENLENLETLDLMGTSISGSALTKLCDRGYLNGKKLKVLNIGNCPNMQFSNHYVNGARMVLDVNVVLKRLFSLEEINLSHASSLNDNTMKLFITNVPFLENLHKLDISHNFEITGISIYEFLKKFQMDHEDDTGGQPLAYLNIDGCSQVSHITVNMLRAQNLVKRVDCAYEREVWKKFGVNSYAYS